MKSKLKRILDHIGESHKSMIQADGEHYMEVNLGMTARGLGYADLQEKYKDAYAMVPIKTHAGHEGAHRRADVCKLPPPSGGFCRPGLYRPGCGHAVPGLRTPGQFDSQLYLSGKMVL